jgi:hypothetical protein
MTPGINIKELSRAELEELTERALSELAGLRQTVEELKGEIARLKEVKGRPKIKPSGMEQASAPKAGDKKNKERKKRGKSQARISETQVVEIAVPAGSQFKGYEDYVVQDVVVRTRVIRYRRQRWLTPDGKTVVAPLPAHITGHFGPELRRLVLALYHEGQTTLSRLLKLVRGFGVWISKRQLQRLLTDKQDGFVAESLETLRAGLSSARWIAVDDTGARHRVRNAVCTCIGNDHFTWFGTTFSKSRLNFLELLRAGYTDYAVNEPALAYLGERGLPKQAIAKLAAHPDKHFADATAWQAHLKRLDILERPGPLDPACLATEGAVWGSVIAHGFLICAVILSDDAGQFNVGLHALCWIHAERLVHTLHAVTDLQHGAQQQVRALIWDFYSDLKAYCADPTPALRGDLDQRFDTIFKRRTDYVTLDRLLARLHANKPELLLALERPEIPLHNNGRENDIRDHVTRRKISAGTRSDIGRDCRDAFLGLAKTCRKLGIEFWDYLGDRLRIPGAAPVPYIPGLVTSRCESA